jgi:hypothetical protein
MGEIPLSWRLKNVISDPRNEAYTDSQKDTYLPTYQLIVYDNTSLDPIDEKGFLKDIKDNDKNENNINGQSDYHFIA